MMLMPSIASQIRKQEQLLIETQKKIEEYKNKEAARIVKIAESTGYFEIEVSDKALADAFKTLVKNAKTTTA